MVEMYETTAFYNDGEYEELDSFETLEEAVNWCKEYQSCPDVTFTAVCYKAQSLYEWVR